MFWLGKWVPHELIENQNAAVLKCLLLLYATTMNHFSIRLWHVSESGFYMTTSHAQLSGWTKKQLDSTFQSQTYIKKKCRFEVLSSLNLCNSNEHFLIRLWRATKSGLCKTTSDDQLRGWTKKKLQSTSQRKLAPKKAHVHCFVACCPSDPLQLSESQWNHHI